MIIFGFILVAFAGCAWVQREEESKIPSLSLLDSRSGTKNESFGYAVSLLPDLNGDGKAEFMVGAPLADAEGIENVGIVYIYSLTNPNPLSQKIGERRFGIFGAALNFGGDLDGDGKGDFLIGAPGSGGDPNISDEGFVYVYSGANAAFLYKKPSPMGNVRFGTAISLGGDVDGDARADFIVGAPLHAGGKSQAGMAYVFSGKSGTPELWSQAGSSSSDQLGSVVATLGDINGDGKGEYLAAAPYADPGGKTDAGVVYIFSGANGQLLYQVSGEAANDRFGSAVTSIRDINGDGKEDFLVGAPYADPQGTAEAGSLYLFSGVDGSLIYQKNGRKASDRFGLTLSSVGDINSDGKGDFLVGVPGANNGAGAVYLFSGAEGTLLYQQTGSANESLGISLASGDVNGDGKTDFLIGASETVYIYSLP